MKKVVETENNDTIVMSFCVRHVSLIDKSKVL